MRKRLVTAIMLLALLAVGVWRAVDDSSSTGQAHQDRALTASIKSLVVAAEDGSGYDRDAFGEYDRDAVLDASMDEHGCYYSAADDECHDDPGDVHVDHLVALAEAWASGLDAGQCGRGQ